MNCHWCGKSLVTAENLAPNYHNDCLKRKIAARAKRALKQHKGPIITVI